LLIELLPPAAIPVLVELLDDDDPWIRYYAATTLLNHGTHNQVAIAALSDLVRTGTETIQRRVIDHLGHLGPEARAAVPALVERFRDQQSNSSLSAEFALSQIDPVTAAVEMTKLDEPTSHLRAAIILSCCDPSLADETVPILIMMIKGKHENARFEAFCALAELGYLARKAIPALVGLLNDECERTRETAFLVLNMIDPEATCPIGK
jgi:HEAT repeat protein